MSRTWSILGWIAIPMILAGFFLARDRQSLERGNRLYRDGRPAEAARVYRSLIESEGDPVSREEVDREAEGEPEVGSEPQVGSEPDAQAEPTDESDPTELYNLGTALARDDTAAERATTYLERAVEAADSLESAEALESRNSVALQRAHYNLGLRYLDRLEPFLRLDSAFFFVSAAVSHNREALVLDPADENARWNLALAQRSLDSLLVQMAVVDDRDPEEVEDLDGIEFDSGMLTRAERSDPDALPPPEGTRPDPDEEVAEDPSRVTAATEGAREALEGRDPGVIDRDRALETLRGFEDDPEAVVRGILWIQRPDVAWWDRTPYPGGNR